jgi:hypothetical protein
VNVPLVPPEETTNALGIPNPHWFELDASGAAGTDLTVTSTALVSKQPVNGSVTVTVYVFEPIVVGDTAVELFVAPLVQEYVLSGKVDVAFNIELVPLQMLAGLAVADVIPTTVLDNVVVATFTHVVVLFEAVTVYVVEPAVERL